MSDAELRAIPAELLQPADSLPNPPVRSRPQTLPCGELTWENFERLCVEVAPVVDVTTDRRLYGVPGQKQDGIDVYARLASGDRVVYQVRRVKSVGATALRKAVTDFVTGIRPFDPRRFVYCARCRVRSPAVLRELERLRDLHRGDLQLDVYDEEELSRLLRPHRDIVERFFGPAWRDLFCDPPSTSVSTSTVAAPGGPTADEVLRGPIVSLGLSSDLTEAQASVQTDPASSAQIYGRLAHSLEKRGFTGHATAMRTHQAESLAAARNRQAAFTAWFELARVNVEEGTVAPYPKGLRETEPWLSDLSDAERAMHTALDGFAIWYEGPEVGRERMRSGAEVLVGLQHPLAPLACLWLAEAASVDEDDDLLRSVLPMLRQAVEMTGDEAVRIRLRLIVAEVEGAWARLVRDASSGRLDPAWAGLVHLRYGRWLAWHAEPESAEDAYRRAVEGATAAGFPGDVAEALYAIMMVRNIYGSVDDLSEIGEINEIAMAVRGTRSRLGARHSPREHALAYLLQGSMPEAHLRLRRYLWEARLGGHFRAEREAHDLLGDLYEKSDETDMAMAHYLLAGSAEKAAALAARLSAPIDLQASLSHSAPWIQGAALAAIAEESKILPSDQVVTLVPTLLSLTGGAIQGLFGPQVDISAIKALAALSLQVPEDRVNDLVAVFEPLIAPSKGRYHFADDAIVDGLVDLYCGHPEAQERIGALLVRCLGEPMLAKRATSRLHGIIPLGQDLVERLRGLALSNRQAAELLAASGDTTPEVLSTGGHRVATILSQQQRVGHASVTVGGVDATASVFALLLSSERQEALARHWVRHASNAEDLEINRAQAVQGIGILAHALSRDLRSELFDAVLPLADPDVAVSADDEMQRQSMHPLSRFRIDFGAGSLPRAAAQTCAALATTSLQAKTVADMALVWLRSSSLDDLQAAAVVIRVLDPKLITFDVPALASHPSVEVRRVAVILWARDGNRDASLSKVFASDRDFRVRLELAAATKTVAGDDRELATKLRNGLANDPHAWVRWRAVRGPQESSSGRHNTSQTPTPKT